MRPVPTVEELDALREMKRAYVLREDALTRAYFDDALRDGSVEALMEVASELEKPQYRCDIDFPEREGAFEKGEQRANFPLFNYARLESRVRLRKMGVEPP